MYDCQWKGGQEAIVNKQSCFLYYKVGIKSIDGVTHYVSWLWSNDPWYQDIQSPVVHSLS